MFKGAIYRTNIDSTHIAEQQFPFDYTSRR